MCVFRRKVRGHVYGIGRIRGSLFIYVSSNFPSLVDILALLCYIVIGHIRELRFGRTGSLGFI